MYAYRCCDVGTSYFLTVRFLYVIKFTTLIPLSLLLSCKLSFPIVSLIMHLLPTLGLKRLTEFSYDNYEVCQTHVPIPFRSRPSHHQSYLLFRHEQ
jgi:hypothetical protein